MSNGDLIKLLQDCDRYLKRQRELLDHVPGASAAAMGAALDQLAFGLATYCRPGAGAADDCPRDEDGPRPIAPADAADLRRQRAGELGRRPDHAPDPGS